MLNFSEKNQKFCLSGKPFEIAIIGNNASKIFLILKVLTTILNVGGKLKMSFFSKTV